MQLMTIWVDVATTVTIASGLCNFLPKSTIFDKYPRFKNFYETAINLIAFFAANIRKQLPGLDVHIPGLGFTPPVTSDPPTENK